MCVWACGRVGVRRVGWRARGRVGAWDGDDEDDNQTYIVARNAERNEIIVKLNVSKLFHIFVGEQMQHSMHRFSCLMNKLLIGLCKGKRII